MDSDRTFPKNTPRWLSEVRIYWAEMTSQRTYRRSDRSSDNSADDQSEQTESDEAEES